MACSKMHEPEYPPAQRSLEEVFSDNTYQLTGVAVSKEGRLFTNYPLWSDIYKYAVVEVKGDSQSLPYPDLAWNTAAGEKTAERWICVQAVHVDDSNTLWVVDPASPKMKGVVGNGQKLVKMSLGSNRVERIYSLAGVTDDQSYINDVRVDRARHTAYLTNSTEGGIVVVDLISGQARQVLQGTASVTADPSYVLTIDGHPVMKNGAPFKGNSDGLALTPDGSYLYYKPLTDDKLYRIRTAHLRDTSLTAAVLASKVEYLGRFTTTDGMIFDKHGNLYLGDLERYRIVRIDSYLNTHVLIEDKRLIWPDSYQVTDEGYLYISISQIHRQPEYNNGINKRTSPYKIYRVKLPGY
jgi:sugar lactone lactonase YvrE